MRHSNRCDGRGAFIAVGNPQQRGTMTRAEALMVRCPDRSRAHGCHRGRSQRLTQTMPSNSVGADRSVPANASAFMSSGGEMAALIVAKDWSDTPLGPLASWPRSLQTALRILVTSRYAMWLGWGPDLVFFYNDAYRSMTLGGKHPWALGQPASKVWEEIWQDIGPRAESVLHTGNATWDDGLRLFLERSGYTEETYHTFSYSPLPDDDARIGGMLCVVTEETDRVIGERRLATLQQLASLLAAARTEPDMCAAIQRGLGANPHDLPFTLTYLFDHGGESARLVCRTGIAAGHAAAPEHLDSADVRSVWPAHAIQRGIGKVVLDDLSFVSDLPIGAWSLAPRAAVAVPIVQQGQSRPAGMFVTGLNPYRPLDEPNARFVDLVAAQIALGLAGARAY